MVTESWYHREVKLLTHESTTTTTIAKLQCGYSGLFIQKRHFQSFDLADTRKKLVHMYIFFRLTATLWDKRSS